MTPWNPRTAGRLEAVAAGVVLLLLSAMLDGAPVSAQTPEQSSAGEVGDVAGRAIDFRNTPVVDATVLLTPDAGQTATTDSEGRFRLVGVPAGRYAIEARTSELTSGTKEIAVRAGETTEVELSLVPAEQTADQIDVTSGYSVNRSDPVSATPLSSEELHELPNFGNDLVRALRYLPGVSGNDLSAQFNVRGGLYRENMVRIDGLEVFEPYHLKDFQGVFSIFDPQMLGEVDVLTGGFPSEYGDRMTGILDLTATDPSQRWRYDLGISLSTASASGAGTFADGKGRWLGSLRRGWLDLVLKIADPDEESEGDGPAYWDAHGRVDYQLTPSQSLTANLLASDASHLRLDLGASFHLLHLPRPPAHLAHAADANRIALSQRLSLRLHSILLRSVDRRTQRSSTAQISGEPMPITRSPLPITFAALLVFQLLLLPASVLAQQPRDPARNAPNMSELPDWIPGRSTTEKAFWLSASAISDAYRTGKERETIPAGILDLLDSPGASTNSDSAQYRIEGCLRAQFGLTETEPLAASFVELAAASDLVSGDVVESVAGFMAESIPGQLLRVRVQESFGRATFREVITFVPGGVLEINGIRYCADILDHPPPPYIGQRVVMALRHDSTATPRGLEVRQLYSGGMFYEDRGGRIKVPARWEALFASNRGAPRPEHLAQLIDRLRKGLGS